jgi:hypothetical protein
LTDEEMELLSGALEQHLQGLGDVNPLVCEDPSIQSWDTLLEVTADTARETIVLEGLKGRIDELIGRANG